MPLPTRTAVLVVGGGPVGLALAAELGWRGIDCVLIEQGDGVVLTPKMNEVNIRTMEFCRRWGIADKVLNCPFPADYPLDVAFVTSLSGYELARMRRPSRSSQVPDPASPMRLQACSQHWFDPMLQELARSFATVSLHYGCRLESFETCAGGVIASVADVAAQAQCAITAEYLVGCDGAGSLVRRGLGIELVGSGTIGAPVNMFFRAPGLLERCGRDPGTFFLGIDRGAMWGNLRAIDPAIGLWRLMVDDTGGDVTPETVDRAYYLRRALGFDLDVEWIDVNIWRRRSAVAERYGEGRVWLAGDAVHQLSPTGGLGMNTGIGDAVDLGWKLTAVLQGWGGPRLLDSYDGERRPVGMRNVAMATAFHRNNASLALAGDLNEDSAAGAERRRQVGEGLLRDTAREFRTVGLQIGYAYEPSPIVVPDGTIAPSDDPANYTPSARPGARAPHMWLRDGRSTLDLFGRSFVLLAFAGAPPTGPLESAARSRAVPLDVVRLDEPEVAAIYERKLVLVRPDGHVAWRGDAIPEDVSVLIDRVRGG